MCNDTGIAIPKEHRIILTVQTEPRKNVCRTVRISREAGLALCRLSDRTGLTFSDIASALITQAAAICEITYSD